MTTHDTQADIEAAHRKANYADTPQLPYRNIRDVLALHAKIAPGKTYLIFYDDDGQRHEYDYAEFVARVHQVANLMYEDLKVERGDEIATIGHNHSDMLLIYYACWIVGAAVVPQNVERDDADIAAILRKSNAKICFVMDEYLERAETIINGGDGSTGNTGVPNMLGMVQVGGTIRDDYVNLQNAAGNRPITFLGDESGAKAADMPLSTGNQRTATLDDAAVILYTDNHEQIMLTQYNLLVSAAGIAQGQAISGNQRMMCVLPVYDVNGIVVTLITPLLTGGSVVLNTHFEAANFWERVVKERVSVVSVVPALLKKLLAHSQKLDTEGDTLFGNGITRRDMTRFRHFICEGNTLTVDLVRDFEKSSGFPVLSGYALPQTGGFSSFLPITLSWSEHQAWLQDYETPSIGSPVASNDMAILDKDGNLLAAGERGEICIRGHNVMAYATTDNAEHFKYGWYHSGDEGFYEADSQENNFFFITGQI